MKDRHGDQFTHNAVTENDPTLPAIRDQSDRPESKSPHRRSAADDQAQQIVAVARHFAFRRKVSIDHVDDCALEFYLLYLKSVRQENISNTNEPSASDTPSTSAEVSPHLPPISRLADNHAHNYQRRERQYGKLHAVSLTDDSEASCRLVETLADPTSDPHAQVLLAELREEIERALDTLPSIDRMIFILHYVHHHSLRDLANRFGMSYTSIKFRLGVIRKHLCCSLKSASSS